MSGSAPLRGHRAAVLRQPHRDLGLRVGAFGHRVHLVELQLGLVRHQRLDAVEHRVDRPVALASSIVVWPSMSSFMVARCGPWVPAITVSEISLMRSWAVAISSSTSASMSSS